MEQESIRVLVVDDSAFFREALREGLFNARLQIIENAGHLVMLERPHLVADLLKEFVDSIPPRVRKPRKKKIAAAPENIELL